MENITRKSDSSQPATETAVYLFDDWFDPIEAGVRDRVREFIQAMVEGELDAALMRPRYGRRSQSSSGDADGPVGVTGHRHGHRSRSLMGTFGRTEIAVPRARLDGPDGQTTEWKSKILRAYQRRTLAADALIASTYLAAADCTNAISDDVGVSLAGYGCADIARFFPGVASLDAAASRFSLGRAFAIRSRLRYVQRQTAITSSAPKKTGQRSPKCADARPAASAPIAGAPRKIRP